MVNYREILRMTADGSYGIRQIKADAHCSYEKIRETQEAAKAKGIKWPLDDDVTNEELHEFLFPGKRRKRSVISNAGFDPGTVPMTMVTILPPIPADRWTSLTPGASWSMNSRSTWRIRKHIAALPILWNLYPAIRNPTMIFHFELTFELRWAPPRPGV